MAEVKKDPGALLKLGVLAALLVGGALVAAFTPLGDYLSREGIGQGIEWLRASRAAPLIYVAIYTAATALAIPGSILTLAGGAMFGVVGGTLYTTIGANLGANAAFAIARFLGRGGIERLAGARLDALDKATANHGFRGMLTLRLIPAIPFNALNFGSGLTSIRWSTYSLATALGIFPGTLVYTMFADALLAGSQEASRDALMRVVLSGALLIMLSFLPAIAKRMGVKVPGATASVLLMALSVHAMTAGVLAERVGAQEVPTHEAFSAILADVVVQPSLDYAGLVERRAELDAYLATLASVDARVLAGASREVQLAFWINAYNACMLRQVAENYPIEKDGRLLARMRNSVAGRPANSVWQIPDVFADQHCRIAGEDRSQDDIEHGIVRPMGDPRIHFAVNCAAKSCPVLWPDAYEAITLDEQLDRAVAHLVASPEHFAVEGLTIRLNRVLDWFKADFGGTEGVRKFLEPYVSPETAAILADLRTSIEYFEYDWTLNDIER